MSIKAVAVVMAPNESIHHGQDLCVPVTHEDGSEELARQTLMNQFARTVLGDVFTDIDPTDAWAFWQIAQKNGYRIKQMPVTTTTTE